MARPAHLVRRASSRMLPAGPLDLLRQIVLFCGAYYVYRIVRGIVDGQAVAAFEHARQLIHIEQSMGLFFEPSVQHWAEGQDWPITFANWMYVNSHFVITTTFLAWLYLARNRAFYFVRNMFLVAMGLALVLYVLYPTAPPRFMPEFGFRDTVADFVGQAAEDNANLLYNPFAAVPSMHVAFSLMIGIPAVMLVKHRALKVLWAIYPAVVSFVVIATGNHFWVDGALGALVAAVSAYAATAAFARLRPEAWGWHPTKVPV
jgi:membrane-associated phospholipid phosphatase